MAWCCQATSHHLCQCWPRSMSPYDITRPQCVNCQPPASSRLMPWWYKEPSHQLTFLVISSQFVCNILYNTWEFLYNISMAWCKTAVTPLLMNWSYCSLALSPWSPWHGNSQNRALHMRYNRHVAIHLPSKSRSHPGLGLPWLWGSWATVYEHQTHREVEVCSDHDWCRAVGCHEGPPELPYDASARAEACLSSLGQPVYKNKPWLVYSVGPGHASRIGGKKLKCAFLWKILWGINCILFRFVPNFLRSLSQY